MYVCMYIYMTLCGSVEYVNLCMYVDYLDELGMCLYVLYVLMYECMYVRVLLYTYIHIYIHSWHRANITSGFLSMAESLYSSCRKANGVLFSTLLVIYNAHIHTYIHDILTYIHTCVYLEHFLEIHYDLLEEGHEVLGFADVSRHSLSQDIVGQHRVRRQHIGHGRRYTYVYMYVCMYMCMYVLRKYDS